MKVFALLLLIGFAAATTEWKWESGKEYHFDYSGRLLTGIPSLASQYSGLGINSTVVLSVQSKETLSLVIKEPRFVRVNDVLEPVEDNVPSTYDGTNWRRLRLPEMTSVPEEYRTILAMPVVIKLASNGEVSKITISKEEPEWSVNYKKGIVSLFQTKMDSTTFELEENLLETPTSEPRTHWKVKEETVSGRCEVSYQINELPEYIIKENPILVPYPEVCPEQKYYEVIRSVNFENCEKVSTFSFYRPGQFMCGGSGENINNCGTTLTRSSSTRYIACGSRSASTQTGGQLVMQSVVNDGESNVSLMGTKTEKMVSGSLQSLRLKEVKTLSGSIPTPSQPIDLDTLMYEYTRTSYGLSETNSIAEKLMNQGRIPKSQLESGKVLSKSIPKTFLQGLSTMEAQRSFSEEIKTLLKDITSVIRGESGKLTESQINMKILSVVRGMTTLKTKEEISQVYHSLISEASGEKQLTYKQLFLDSIVMTGTPQAFEFIGEIIRQGNLPRSEINSIFMWLPHYVVLPTEQVLTSLFKLITETETIKSHPTTYSVAITGFTQLVQSACISESRKTSFPTAVYGEFCTPESEIVQETLIPYLARELRTTSDENLKNVHIVALGLLTHKNVISELTPIVDSTLETSSKSGLTRMLATYSLGMSGLSNPELVTPIMLSVFTNPSETTEMRVVAFNTLLKMNPPMHVFHTIASTTQNEPSMDMELLKTINIGLFTLGHELPTEKVCEKTLSLITKCRATYPLIKKTYGIIPSTGVWYKTEFLKELGAGYESYLIWISGQESILPRNSFFTISYFLENYYFNAFQLGYRLTGSDSLLDKVGSMLTGLRGSQSDLKDQIRSSISSEWNKIVEKLQLKTRESDEISGSFFFRLFESGIFFKSFSDRTSELMQQKISKILTNPRSLLAGEMKLNVQKSFDVSPIEMLFPSEMGFPINVEFHAPVTVSLDGEASVNPETTVPSFHVSGKALLTSQITGWVGTVCPFTGEYVVSGMNQHSVVHVPGKLEVKLDIPSQKFSVFVKPTPGTNGPVDMFHYHVMPYTVHEKIDSLVPMTMSPNTKPIKSTSPVKELSYTFGEYLGIGLKTQVKTESRFVDFRSFVELIKIYKNPLNMMLFGWTSPALSERMTPSVRRHQLTIRYDPTESSTKEIGMEFKIGCATKKQEEGIKYHSLKTVESTVSSHEQTLVTPTIESIVKSILPIRIRSEAIESSSVHPRRQMQLSEAMKQLDAEETTGFTIIYNLILKGSRPRTLTYSLTTALGSSQEETSTIRQKWNVKLETPHLGSPVKAICVNGHLTLPILPMWNIDQIRSSHVNFRFNNVISFGPHSCGQSKIETTGTTLTSYQQKALSRHSAEAKQCQKLIEQGVQGSLTSHACEQVRKQATSLDKVDFTTTYTSVPSFIKKSEETLISYLKAYLWPYYTPSKSQVRSSSVAGQTETYTTKTELTFKQQTPSYDLTISRPNEFIHFKDIHIKYPYSLFFPLKAHGNNVRLALNKITTGSVSGQTCLVDSKTVTTYDNKTVSFVQDKCFHVLTADCSQYKRFGVTARSLEGNKKEVKLHLKTTTVELIPTGPSSVRGPKVIVDGQETSVPTGKVVKITGTIGSIKKTIATVTRTVDGVVIVKSPELLLDELRTDGEHIQILPSPLLKNKLCGVCGDFNNQLKADISGPSKCVYSRPELEVAAYRIQTDSCPPLPQSLRAELAKETQQCSQFKVQATKVAKSFKVATGGCTLLRHLMIQNGGMLCISKNLVTECSSSCKSERSQLVEKTVPFACFPQGPVANKWMMKVITGSDLQELSTLPTLFSTKTEQPRHCVPALTRGL